MAHKLKTNARVHIGTKTRDVVLKRSHACFEKDQRFVAYWTPSMSADMDLIKPYFGYFIGFGLDYRLYVLGRFEFSMILKRNAVGRVQSLPSGLPMAVRSKERNRLSSNPML